MQPANGPDAALAASGHVRPVTLCLETHTTRVSVLNRGERGRTARGAPAPARTEPRMEATMPKTDLVIRVAGEAGESGLSTGQLLVQGAARAGYRVLTDFSPPPEIKGGYSLFQLRIGSQQFHSRGDVVDLLLAMNQEAVDMSLGELREGGLLIYDPAQANPPAGGSRVLQYAVPMSEIARTQLKFELGKNVVAVGVLAALFGMPEEYLQKLLQQRFGGRGQDILDENIATSPDFNPELFAVERGQPDANRIVVSGNQAVSLGALAAGVGFFAGYP